MIKNIYIWIMSFIIRSFMRTLCKTYRIVIRGRENVKEKGLFAVWHQASFALFEANPFRPLVVLTANGTKGDVFTKAVEGYGYKMIRVPYDDNRKEAAVALVQTVKAVEEGFNVVIAVDGPHGPLHSVKPGIFYLSKRTGTKIFPVGLYASAKITIPLRWDKYFVPLPFSKIVIYIDSDYSGDNETSLKQAIIRAEEKARQLS